MYSSVFTQSKILVYGVIVMTSLKLHFANGQFEICNAIVANCEADRFSVCYKKMIMFHKEESWFRAMEKCKEIGMRLLTPSTQGDNIAIREYLNKRIWGDGPVRDIIHWYLWTSGTNDNKENVWKWATTNETFTHTVWNSGEPNGGPDEKCMEIRFAAWDHAVWNDGDCHVRKRYICETRDHGLV